MGPLVVEFDYVSSRRFARGCEARVFAVTGTVTALPIASYCLVLPTVDSSSLLQFPFWCTLDCHLQGMATGLTLGARDNTDGGAKYNQALTTNST